MASLRRAGVTVERGSATLSSPNRVTVGEGRVREGRNIVIATGSSARRPDRFSFGDGIVCDSELLLGQAVPPRSLVILGAEEEGCELGSIFSAFGAAVSLVDRRRRLVRFVDRDLLEIFHERLSAHGLHIINGEELEDVAIDARSSEPHATVRLASGRQEKCDRLLVLAGREPRTEGIDVAGLGIGYDQRGFLVVDENGESSVPGIYAVGDVTGYPFRAGPSVHQAWAAVRHMVGEAAEHTCEVPLTVYGIPEASVVGVGSDACSLLGVPCVVGATWTGDSFDHCGSHLETTRLKLIFDADGAHLMGVQIVGPSAGELINLGSFLVGRRASAEEISKMVFNRPSQASAYRTAALEVLSSA